MGFSFQCPEPSDSSSLPSTFFSISSRKPRVWAKERDVLFPTTSCSCVSCVLHHPFSWDPLRTLLRGEAWVVERRGSLLSLWGTGAVSQDLVPEWSLWRRTAFFQRFVRRLCSDVRGWRAQRGLPSLQRRWWEAPEEWLNTGGKGVGSGFNLFSVRDRVGDETLIICGCLSMFANWREWDGTQANRSRDTNQANGPPPTHQNFLHAIKGIGYYTPPPFMLQSYLLYSHARHNLSFMLTARIFIISPDFPPGAPRKLHPA